MEHMELKELIYIGAEYIGFETSKEITINMLIEIRKYLLTKSAEWYEKKFPEAYNFDIGKTRKKGDAYYKDDGIEYEFNDEMYLVKCTLYDSTKPDKKGKECKVEPPVQFPFPLDKNKYYYINEIDHFFTYCINRYLNDHTDFRGKEKGITAIQATIEGAAKNGRMA